jgi:hypothetical protein
MARFTKSQKQKLKQLILIGDIHRHTETEMLQFIRESLGYDVHVNTIYKIRRENRYDKYKMVAKDEVG